MPTYIVEREIPNIGLSDEAKLTAIAQNAKSAIEKLDKEIVWIHSFITDDKMYCMYEADSEKLILQHGKIAGYPVNKVSQISNKIGPLTGSKS